MVAIVASLLFCAAYQGGVTNMTNNLLVEFAAHFAIAVGSRVDDRTSTEKFLENIRLNIFNKELGSLPKRQVVSALLIVQTTA